MDITRLPYTGSERKLVVALDIGNTSSGAAYMFLDPGEIPQIRPVTKFLNNPNPGLANVPSVLYYDRVGNFCGVENGVDFLDEDAFLKMKWWKQMLSPAEPPVAMKDRMSSQLPLGKTIVDVFADFMRYLFDSTEAIFKESEPNGELRRNSISSPVELVLTHPSGWGSPQRAKLRTAAIKAGIIPDTPARHASVHFVTKREASFSFCASESEAGRTLKPGDRTLFIDAGSETIDISTYKIIDNRPLRVEELYEPKCLVQGEDLVTARATVKVKERLQRSRFNTPEDLVSFSQGFDEGVKKVFSMSNYHASHYVRFISPRGLGTKGGMLAFTGTEVSGFFEPSIQSTVDFIRDNFRGCSPDGTIAFLTGSFAACPWFSEQLQIRLSGLGFQFCKPDMDTKRAVAIGALSYYVDHFLPGTISKFADGVVSDVLYDPSDLEHVRRAHKTFTNAAGERRVPSHFDVMLTRGTRVLEDSEIRHSFGLKHISAQYISVRFVRYTGTSTSPKWVDEEPDKFETLCYVKADISKAPYAANYATVGHRREYGIILLVGLTELKAQLCWIDSRTREEKRSDAVVTYEDPSEGA